jgi:hypothetical protein
LSIIPHAENDRKSGGQAFSGMRFYGYIPWIEPICLPTRNSTDTALQYVITHIEEAVKNMQVTLGAFLHIERAFDSNSFEIITKSAR